jgi:hypothetical protein
MSKQIWKQLNKNENKNKNKNRNKNKNKNKKKTKTIQILVFEQKIGQAWPDSIGSRALVQGWGFKFTLEPGTVFTTFHFLRNLQISPISKTVL